MPIPSPPMTVHNRHACIHVQLDRNMQTPACTQRKLSLRICLAPLPPQLFITARYTCTGIHAHAQSITCRCNVYIRNNSSSALTDRNTIRHAPEPHTHAQNRCPLTPAPPHGSKAEAAWRASKRATGKPAVDHTYSQLVAKHLTTRTK